MLAVAGAVLINAACVLMASGQDTVTIYALVRIPLFIGAGLMTADIQGRLREFVKKAKADGRPQS